ncbi:MAG TPA: hypothetical protein DIT25_03545 [Candidatus Moranbacteria bacterium]|nr:hypothetical protein [Candidatus Moranbacteria bacterium]
MQFQDIVNNLNRPKTWLLSANVFFVFLLIILSNLELLPIRNLGDFIFYTLLYLAFALYRPGWSFLFFVGTIMLENINLAPEEIGIMVRPYQFIGGLTVLAVLIKSAVKKLGFSLPKWNRYDLLFIIFAIAGFLSAIGAEDKILAFKQSAVALSFVAFYFLTRIFIQNLEDLKRVVPFFLSSSVIVVLYGIWQNIRFSKGLEAFEIMPGRPNATFTEPDWLGIFLVFLLAVIYAIINYRSGPTASLQDGSRRTDRYFKISNQIQISKAFFYVVLTASYILLILTVARSAWLGAAAMTFAFLFIILTNLKFDPKKWNLKLFFQTLSGIVVSGIVALAVVYIFNLTSFQLFNRAQSTGSGLQKITVSCQVIIVLPERIRDISDLEKLGCRHIDLEEITAEMEKGNFVRETYRPDPNINIRKEIYQKSWQEIKENPILGIGWGNIGKVLGTDENGNALNSSNIFLEVWLGAGLLGLAGFALIWIYVILDAIRVFISSNPGARPFGLFLFLGFFSILIPNIFNAGIFLGFIWLFLGLKKIKV